MDPDFYRTPGSLPPSLNRYTADITSLLAEQSQGITPGLGLPSSFPPSTLSSAAARSFGPLPGYAGHSLHGLPTQLTDNHIQNIAAQSSYKNVAQGSYSLSDPYVGLRLGTQPSNSIHSKPLFTQDTGPPKDASYSSSVTQSPTLDMSQKHWALSSYVTQGGNPFGIIPADLSSSDFLSSAVSSQPSPAPPPAHSSKHSSSLQRTMYPSEDILLGRETKSPLQRSSTYEYRDSGSTQSQLTTSQANSLFSFNPDLTYQTKSESSSFNDMKYEAVSPATPGESQQTAGSESYHVSLQDLASISSTQEKLEVHQSVQKAKPPVVEEIKKTDSRTRSHRQVPMQQDMYAPATPTGQMSQIKPNQSQQPPVGGSPQNQMPLGSPQAPMPSTTFVTAPPPVQAPADSTTKPKRGRGRKKKEPVPEPKKDIISAFPESAVQYGQQIINPAVRDQPFSNSLDVAQRNSGNEYTNQQQSYMQSSRTPQPSYSSSSNDNVQTNSPLMASSVMGAKPSVGDINQFNKGPAQPQQQQHVKNEPSPSMTQPSPVSVHQMSPMAAPQQSPMAVPQQSPLAGPQQSPMMVRFQSPSPMSSQSGAQYSVSDALEMSREAMFTNQPVVEGYSGTEMNSYPLQDSFSSQLGMQRADVYGSQEDSYSAQYGGQFVSPNNVLAVDISDRQPAGQASTIDEGALASLMDESYDPNQHRYIKQEYGHIKPEYGHIKQEYGQDPYANFPLTVKAPDQDDEFCHLAQAPKEKTVDNKDFINQTIVKQESLSNPAELNPPPRTPRMDIKAAAGGSSFMDSYLNFLQGKKPETLSSMSSAIIHNKPQLPKYIPEPRRPRPVEVPKDVSKSDDSRTNSPKRDNDSKSETGSAITFSDDETEDKTKVQINSAVKSAISNLEDINNDKIKISTNKSGGLTMKINLAKVKTAEANARKAKAAKSKRSPGKSKKKGKGKIETYGYHGNYSSGEEDYDRKAEESPEPEPVPQRELSSRKAKQKQTKYTVDSDEDSDTLKPISKEGYESDEHYDSDRDPVWTPLEISKKTASFDAIDFSDRKKKSRSKGKSKSSKSRRSHEGVKAPVPVPKTSLSQEDLDSLPPVAKIPKTQPPVDAEISSDSEPEVNTLPAVNGDLQVGEFVMEKKDIKNYETYPIWKIESGRMLHKFELFAEESRILHRAIPTFSSWLPNMRNGFLPVKVKPIRKQGDLEYVEVLEESRPKLLIDKQLEEKYEEHPLIDVFNVYLQIFLSQALEPGFLSAIIEEKERFYLDALERIDGDISRQLEDIESKVRWKGRFKEGLRLHPHIRELDRPNLKQACQACEFASQPAIKSVHLFGNPYDRFTLQELPVPGGAKPSLEFMIGKTAAKYVRPYHSLYHFKYNLYKRCLAKVNITKDSSDGKETDAILDQCLQNRAWVLQIFEDLKKMLEKG